MQDTLLTVFRRCVGAVLAALPLASPGLANTWIVDQANGPGTNFTEIAAAIQASAPGDVLIVRQGNYAAFTLPSGLSLLGQGSVKVTGSIRLNGVPEGETAVLYNIEPQVAWGNPIQVLGCRGTVLLQRIDCAVHVSGSRDVRLHDVTRGALSFDSMAHVSAVDSRVQIVSSWLQGGNGWYADCGVPAEDGGDGLQCSGASLVHLARTDAVGGLGGLGYSSGLCWPPMPAGYPGTGLRASGNGSSLQLILSGPELISSGAASAPAAVLGSGVTAWASNTSFVGPPPLLQGGTLNTLPTFEPTLELIGTPHAGGIVTLRLRAQPGANARLNVGDTALVQATPGVLVENLLLKVRSFDRGSVPPSGLIDSAWAFQPTAPAGKRLIFQARIVDIASGIVQRSNSIETVVIP